jgi:hypothetical protein
LNPPSLATKCSDQFHIEALNSHVAVITASTSIPRRLPLHNEARALMIHPGLPPAATLTNQILPHGLACDDDDVDRRKSTGLSTDHERRNAGRSLFLLKLYVQVVRLRKMPCHSKHQHAA